MCFTYPPPPPFFCATRCHQALNAMARIEGEFKDLKEKLYEGKMAALKHEMELINAGKLTTRMGGGLGKGRESTHALTLS